MKAISILLCLALVGCAQDLGGITKVHYGVDGAGNPDITYESGKEASSISAEYLQTPDGLEVKIDAGDVKAFEGQAIQAERIIAQTNAIAGALQELLPDILKTALCAAGVTTSC